MKKLISILLMVIAINPAAVWANAGCYGVSGGQMCQSSDGTGYPDPYRVGWAEQNLYVTSNVNLDIYSVLTNGGVTIVSTGNGGYFWHYLNAPGQEAKSGDILDYENDGNLYMGAWSQYGTVASIYVYW
jgi:hypothetical protein